jgi:tetratricopeptide (TPR) repeat protein
MGKKKTSIETGPDPRGHIGRQIAVLREALDMSQSDLSRAAQVKRASISAYEAGLVSPDAGTVERLLVAMGFRWSSLDAAEDFLGKLFSQCVRPPDRGLAAEASTGQGEQIKESPVILDGAQEGPSPEDRPLAQALWKRLRALPPKTLERELTEVPDRCAWALCELLCIQSVKLCSQNPVRAKSLITLAEKTVPLVSGDGPWRAKVQGHVLAHRGNALRVAGDFAGAKAALDQAARLFEAGTASSVCLLEEGILPAFKASLCRAERRFDEAAEFLSTAARIARSATFRLQIHVSQAKLFEEQGELEQAIAILREAAESAGETDDARLLLCVRHNLADNLTKLGRCEEAQALLPEIRILLRTSGGELDLERFRWTEARVFAGLGKLEEAIGILIRVRGSFSAHGLTYDTALVSLELALFYLQAGRTREVKDLARHCAPIFQARDVHREALAAFGLFRQAAEQERFTEELGGKLLSYLRRARHDPGMRFKAES